MARKDIREPTKDGISDFDWQDAQGSLQKLYEALVAKADDSINWYQSARKPKKNWSSTLRALTILLFSIAALIPVLQAAEVLPRLPLGLPPNPSTAEIAQALTTPRLDIGQLGYVAAALATALIGLDKFFGFSSGWIRYTLAESAIRRAIAEFQLNWVIANACLDPEEKACPKKRLQLLKEFSLKVTDLVDDETRQWATEFQGSLATLEKSAKDAQDSTRPGMIAVSITRGATVKADVDVLLDGQHREVTTSSAVVLKAISPGLHQVTLRGQRGDGTAVEAQAAATVSPGAITNAAMTLG